MRKPWKLAYATYGRLETSYHASRDAAMSALYARLDMEQRDALSLGEQAVADEAGRLRGAMASAWRQVTRGRTIGRTVYDTGQARISRA